MNLRQTMTFLVTLATPITTLADSDIREASWYDDIKLSGDLRLRDDWTETENSTEARNRIRYRLRLNAKAKVNDDIDAVIRLASGSDDPVSTNQTLDNGASSKALWVDRAYLKYSKNNYQITGGKSPVSFEAANNLIWDGDLNPEGFGATVALSNQLDIITNAWILEEEKSDDDIWMLGAQLVHNWKGMTTALGYYQYTGLAGSVAIGPDDTEFFGNSTTVDGTYASDFGIADLNLIYNTKIGSLPVKGFVDYAVNTQASTTEDTAWQIGFKLGKTKAVGSKSLEYNYRSLQADSILGQFSDSDSCGGGTDCKGHYLRGRYMAMHNLETALVIFIDKQNEYSTGEAEGYNRVFIDIQSKF